MTFGFNHAKRWPDLELACAYELQDIWEETWVGALLVYKRVCVDVERASKILDRLGSGCGLLLQLRWWGSMLDALGADGRVDDSKTTS